MSDQAYPPKHVRLVVDTNLFHECRKLDAADFPWRAIGDFDHIDLVVTDPVMSELDKHKKDTRPRIKRRAILAIGWFRELLTENKVEKVLRDAAPRVVLQTDLSQAPKRDEASLDYGIPDDKIVGIAAALADLAPEQDVRVLSHDTRPCMKAAAIGLNHLFVPDEWMREEEEDEQQKELQRLREENRRLKHQAPALRLSVDGAGEDRKTILQREGFAPVSDDELDKLREALERRFPLPAVSHVKFGSESVIRMPPIPGSSSIFDTYVPPSAEAVEHYRKETYPKWIQECLTELQLGPGRLNRGVPAQGLTIFLSNTGSRPAENVLVTISAQGGLLIAAPPSNGAPESLALPDLPIPPIAPRGHYNHGGMVQHRPWEHPLRHDIQALRPKFDRDQDTFYYHPDRPKVPTREFSFICDRFRHGIEPEPFDILVFPQDDEEIVRGAVLMTVHASNLDQPLAVTVPVQIETTFCRCGYEYLTDLIKELRSKRDI